MTDRPVVNNGRTAPVRMGHLSRKEVIPLLNPYLAEIASIPEKVAVVRHDPLPLLLSPYRFDMMAKYLYARHRVMGVTCGWFEELYSQHIGAFNKFKEGDYSGKQGREAFLKSFHRILDSVGSKGFDETESVVPIDGRGAAIDGSHRVVACAVYEKPVTAVVLDGNCDYDFKFFLQRGLGREYCDSMAMEYCRLEKKAFLVLLYPSAAGRDEQVEGILRSRGKVYYRKDIRLNQPGSLALIRQVYAGEPWLGSWQDRFAGAREKAKECFRNAGPLRVFVYRTEGLEETRFIKEEIRSIYGIGNHSVHINDTEDEKVRLAGTFFNSNSLHFLNFGKPRRFENYNGLLERYRAWLRETGFDRDQFCVDGSAVMSAFGIRDAADLDFLHFGHGDLGTVAPLISSHNSHAAHYPVSRDEIIFDPSRHFFNDGIKFCSLDLLKRMKEKRGDEKDRHDVALIRAAQSRTRAGEFFLKAWPQAKAALRRAGDLGKRALNKLLREARTLLNRLRFL